MEAKIVMIDKRKRISFARVIPTIKPGDRFRAWTTKGGVIVLEPVVVVKAVQ